MLEPDLSSLAQYDRLALAVSGGRDSIALMLLAAHKLPSGRLHVLTVDHKLRPEAAEEARCVRAWAAKLGLSHSTLEWRDAKPNSGTQAAARDARYGLMTAWCRDNGYDALVTAHTLDDQAETVLMRLKRGSGVDGLAAMAPQSWRDGLPLLRPLLSTSREDLTAHLKAAKQPWIDDPSNEDLAFERIQIRKNWHLAEQVGLSKEALARTARKLTRARAALDRAATGFLSRYAEVSDLGVCVLEGEPLMEAAEEVRTRALSRALQAVGGRNYPPGEESLDRLTGWLMPGQSTAITLGGCKLTQRAGKLTIIREAGRIEERAVQLSPGREALWDGRFKITSTQAVPDVTAGPLGTEGWASLKGVRPAIPAAVGRGLPAFRSGECVLAVPSIGYVSPEAAQKAQFSAVFANRGLIGTPQSGQSVTVAS